MSKVLYTHTTIGVKGYEGLNSALDGLKYYAKNSQKITVEEEKFMATILQIMNQHNGLYVSNFDNLTKITRLDYEEIIAVVKKLNKLEIIDVTPDAETELKLLHITFKSFNEVKGILKNKNSF